MEDYASSTALLELRRILVAVPLFQWHQRALDIAEQIGCVRSQGRAYGNLGLTYEALGKHERAVVFQEQHLSVAAQTNDLLAKTLAYGSLGRIHHALQNYAQAVMYLQEGRNATNRRFDPPYKLRFYILYAKYLKYLFTVLCRRASTLYKVEGKFLF